MANALTGDFEAVLQVSGGLIDRLLASMHQNVLVNPQLPTMPHSAYVRIGDEHPVDGVRGTVQVQIGVPRLELIDGATDSFWLEVGVRARFRADPDSDSFPEIIHGTVRAEYHLQDIDPSCWGWAGLASKYLWIRVVEGSVSFSGTASAHAAQHGPELALDLTGIEDRIARQVAALLEKRFQATPHEVSSRFRRGAMRSLNRAGGTGVVIPVGLNGGTPVGRPDSVGNVFLAGSDMSVAVSREYIESLAQPALDGIVGYQVNVHWHWDLDWGGGAEVDYSVRIDSASAEWGTLGTYGVIKLRIEGQGWAPRVYKSGFATAFVPDASELSATFSAEQILLVGFDQPTERLVLIAPPPYMAPSVTVNYGGPYASDVKAGATTAISNALTGQLPGVITQAQPQIDTMTSDQRKAELRKQLKSIDDQAAIRFQSADFSPDGLVVHGSISLTPRAAPVVSFQKTPEGDGFDAWQSWIPGGQIDRFDWSWTWFDRADGPGGASFEDRFLLLRPAYYQRGKFGLSIGLEQPLPGLDGWGRVCLALGGVQVNTTTGALVRVASRTHCERFGYRIFQRLDGHRLLLREYAQARDPAPGEPVEAGMVSAAAAAIDSTANTLVVYADEGWSEATTKTLREGLAGCRRDDAGLLVLALFREGRLDQSQAAELKRLAPELEAQVLVNEDVQGSWARVLRLPSGHGGVGWRLLSPAGGVTWMHDRDPPVETLARSLDACLLTSPAPQPAPLKPALDVGSQVYASGVGSWLGELIGSHCPPPPVSRFGVGSVVTFVQGDSTASRAELERIAREYGDDGDASPFVAVIADGMDTAEAERLADEVGGGLAAIGDPDGQAGDRMGVEVWPTTVALDERGVVADLRVGAGGDDSRGHGSGAAQTT